MENDSGPESQAIPFLDDVFFKPDIEEAGYLGDKKNLRDEIINIRQALEAVGQRGVTVKESKLIVEKIHELVQISERQTQDIREQILVALLGYFTFSVKTPNKDPEIIQAILHHLVGWGIHNFYKDEEYFFVYSVVETISSNFSMLFPVHIEFLKQFEGLFVQLARNEEDAKVRNQSRELLKLLGLQDHATDTYLDRNTVVSNLKKVSDLQIAKQMVQKKEVTLTHQKELIRKEEDTSHQLRVNVSEPKFKQARTYIFEYLHYMRSAYALMSFDSVEMLDALAMNIVQTLALVHLFRQLEPPSIALITDKNGLISEQTSVLTFSHVVEEDPIHRVKSFIDRFQEIIDSGVKSLFVILPDSEVWLSADYAKDAAEDNESQIKIIDSKTYDFGIGVIFQEAAKLVIKNFPEETILKRIRYTISRLKYWVYVENDDMIKDKAWYPKLLEPSQITRLPNGQGGLFAFHNRSRLLDLAATINEGVKLLENRLDAMVSKIPYNLAVIFVKHSGYGQEASVLVQRLKDKYPSVVIQLVHESELTGSNFGKHIGICVL